MICEGEIQQEHGGRVAGGGGGCVQIQEEELNVLIHSDTTPHELKYCQFTFPEFRDCHLSIRISWEKQV